MLNIVLVEPEIPQNTGNIARTCAHGDDELHLFTGQAACGYRDAVYGPDAFLLFGRESRGLDQAIIDARADRCRRIPMREGARSLNLSNAVAIAAYEALAQQGFSGLV